MNYPSRIRLSEVNAEFDEFGVWYFMADFCDSKHSIIATFYRFFLIFNFFYIVFKNVS